MISNAYKQEEEYCLRLVFKKLYQIYNSIFIKYLFESKHNLKKKKG